MVCACSPMADSPITARRETTSRRHESLSLGNHFQPGSPGLDIFVICAVVVADDGDEDVVEGEQSIRKPKSDESNAKEARKEDDGDDKNTSFALLSGSYAKKKKDEKGKPEEMKRRE